MRSRRRGAALLTAMLIVALVATLAAAMVWRQFRAVQLEAADRARAQASWVLAGALDWARLILREDSTDVDHLGEVWAVPLAEARLSTFLAADQGNVKEEEGPEAFLSGRIEDAQGRYNLRNLGVGTEPPPLDKRTLQLLCGSAGLPNDMAERLATQLHQALVASSDTPNAPLQPQSIAQLSWLGIPPDAIAKLEPWVVLLPQATPINLNTAPREVIAAVFGMDLGAAEHLVQVRKNKPFKSLDEAKPHLPNAVANAEGVQNRAGVSSQFFYVVGRLRLDERLIEQRSLLTRRNKEVGVVWRDRAHLDLGESTGNPGSRAP